MTLTSTGPSRFHIKPVVTVLAVVAFVAGVYAISQQIWTDSQPSVFGRTNKRLHVNNGETSDAGGIGQPIEQIP